MSNNQETDFGFRIRPLSKPDKSSENSQHLNLKKRSSCIKKPPKPDVHPTSKELPGTSENAMAARFQSAQLALTFIGAVAGAG
ncbi:MAG: hypothetical protein OMM_12048, partial [Candidatus Magnetoglobus multicellularis str. Araruama]